MIDFYRTPPALQNALRKFAFPILIWQEISFKESMYDVYNLFIMF